jgi:hypothetical protein
MDRIVQRATNFLFKHSDDIFEEDVKLIESLLIFLEKYRFEPNIGDHYSTCAFNLIRNEQTAYEYDICFCFFINKKVLLLDKTLKRYERLFTRLSNKILHVKDRYDVL